MEYGKTKPMGEVMKLLHFWEAQNANKHGDLMGKKDFEFTKELLRLKGFVIVVHLINGVSALQQLIVDSQGLIALMMMTQGGRRHKGRYSFANGE
ncbi:hypothetical protein YC2023_093739 [Brassica napus]